MPDRHEGPVTDPSTWYGCDYANGTDWAHQLTNAELSDLDTALADVTEAGLAPLEFSRDAFQLPVLGPVLAGMLDEPFEKLEARVEENFLRLFGVL